ncbi:FliH/SctL family protein [Cellulomonas sp. URHD0024]|uniref:FliH/SctL family protein n=1 Tax=Cellulomonas sp. URHD0024 TaxID=1302620 RepID=UPI00068852F1|nr:FliH/SctL family protein [Cellulomonas sp. URHD0024]
MVGLTTMDAATTRARSGFVPGGFGVVPPASGAPDAFRPSELRAVELSDDVRDSAHAVGFAAGFAAGARESAAVAAVEAARAATERAEQAATAGALLGQALDVLARAADAASARTALVLHDAEELLHTEAFELARAVLGVELSDHEQSARAALARVLSAPRSAEAVTVHLSPRDLETLDSIGVDDLPDGVRLVADPSLAPGDALAVHPDGYLDARIGAALERARAALAGELA